MESLQVEIDILRERLDLLTREKARLVVDFEAMKTLNQAQSRELVQLRAEVTSRREEVQGTVRRAAQAMQELNEIILKLHKKIDQVCDGWEAMVRRIPMEEDARMRWLEGIGNFRIPQTAVLAEG